MRVLVLAVVAATCQGFSGFPAPRPLSGGLIGAANPTVPEAAPSRHARRRVRRFSDEIVEVEGDYANPNILPLELESELSDSFMRYAMSIIMGRALPDVRDGLKPVHRRILFAMHDLGLRPTGGYRKCARVVGEVLGKFHPHGDIAVYDALVRMAQDFVMAAPLVSGHGNFGSLDNDPPAAMRYTECKLAPLATAALLSDIDSNIVDYVPNFDGNEVEPVILPAKLPVLLLNGATGIAVGMATNIPPHNLGELVDGLVAIIDREKQEGSGAGALPDEELFRLIPAPDFPTGGLIMGIDGARKLYSTGKGSVTVRARTELETIGSNGKKGKGSNGGKPRNAIIVTEVPYLCNKAALLEKIARLVNEKKLTGISDLRDESDRDGVRVVIELKRDAVPAVVLNNLFQKTPLQGTFSGNFLALVDGGKSPGRFSLREALDEFLVFRYATVRRRTGHRLAQANSRLHIVQGLQMASDMIDAIVETVKTQTNQAAAKEALTKAPFHLSLNQSEAVLSLQLGRLTTLDNNKLNVEGKELEEEIKGLSELLESDAKVFSLIRKELLDLKHKFDTPRRTEIAFEDEGQLQEQDLISNDRSVVVVTRAGYIKRMPLDDEFSTAQGRGTRGKAGAKLSDDEDEVHHFFTCNDHDSILFMTSQGILHSVRAWQVPKATRTAKGVPLPSILPITMQAGDSVASVLPVSSFEQKDRFLLLVTTQGWIKKTPLDAFASITARGLTAVNLGEGDEVRWARICTSRDTVILGTRDGYAAHFNTDDQQLRSTGRQSRGVRSMKMRQGDVIVDMDVLPEGSDRDILIMTTLGYGKRATLSDFALRNRGGMGVIATKFKKANEGEDALACLRGCSKDDEVMISTSNGIIVRQKADAIARQSRAATGVLVQRLDKDSRITDVALVPTRSTQDMEMP